MFPTPPPLVPSLQARVHPDEWQARLQLAACYRIFALLGWTEMIYNHITLRLPDSVSGGEMRFLINPFGLHYSEVTASNLVKINLAGDKLDDTPYPINPAGFVLHSTLHAGLPQAHAVMHTHTTAGVAVASLRSGLSQSNFYSAQLHDMVAYHDFEGITVHAEEGPRVLRSIGQRQAVILRNHGLLSWGRSLPEALAILWTLQRACEIQMATQAMGEPLPVPEAIAARCTHDSLQFDAQYGGGVGQDLFEALVRQVDRLDSGWRA